MDMTDMMVMGQFGFKLALVFHIAGALCLFGALGMETLGVFWLRHASTTMQIRLAFRFIRRLPILFGISGGVVLLSGLYLSYLDWSNNEAIGWIIVSLVTFVITSIIGSLTGRWLVDKISSGLSGDTTVAILQQTVRSNWVAGWTITNAFLIFGILTDMIFQPSAGVAFVIIIVALLVGVGFAILLTKMSPLSLKTSAPDSSTEL